MTITETADLLKVNEKTVRNWCQKNLIRGVIKKQNGEFVIPSSVKKPYTKSRSKGDAIYISIVKGTLEGYDVTPALYHMSENEFKTYVNQLQKVGVIDTYADEKTRIKYLCRTIKSSDFIKLKKSKIKAFLQNVKLSGNVNIGINIGK